MVRPQIRSRVLRIPPPVLLKEYLIFPLSGRNHCLFFPTIPLTSWAPSLLTARVFSTLLGSSHHTLTMHLWFFFLKKGSEQNYKSFESWTTKEQFDHIKANSWKTQIHRDSKSRVGRAELMRCGRKEPLPSRAVENCRRQWLRALPPSTCQFLRLLDSDYSVCWVFSL